MTESAAAATPGVDAVSVPSSGWSIDRRVPLPMIVFLATQLCVVSGGATVMLTTVSNDSRRITVIEESRIQRHDVQAEAFAALRVDLAKLSARVELILALQRHTGPGAVPDTWQLRPIAPVPIVAPPEHTLTGDPHVR